MRQKHPASPSLRRPSDYGPGVWWRVLRRVLAEADARNLGLISAGVAFYAMLSVFPALAALIALWGIFADPLTISAQLDLARPLLPGAAFSIVEDQADALSRSNDSTLQLATLVSLGLALWTARNGVAAMIRGLNAVYREDHRRGTLKRLLIAIGLTALLIAVALLAFAAVVLVPLGLALVSLPFGVEALVSVLKWVIVAAVVLFSVSLLYRTAPNRRAAQLRWLTPGAIWAVAAWLAGSLAFSAYLRNFGALNEVYGSIGAAIALLLWFHLSAYMVLLGALLNAELELQTARDTTVGPPRPAGQRDAFVADHVTGPDGTPRAAADDNESEKP